MTCLPVGVVRGQTLFETKRKIGYNINAGFPREDLFVGREQGNQKKDQ